MKALMFPFQIDVNGHVATVSTYPDIVRGQLIDALMTNWDERVMRPQHGCNAQAALFDPTEELVRADAARQIMTRVANHAPRVVTRSVRFTTDRMDPGNVWVDVSYSAGAFDEAREVRLPVAWFMSEETEI